MHDSGVIDGYGNLTIFGKTIVDMQSFSAFKDNTVQAIMYLNLVHNCAQFRWYAQNIDVVPTSEKRLIELLREENQPPKAAKSIITSLKKFSESNLGESEFLGVIPNEKQNSYFKKQFDFDTPK
ncbi:hypothetical protein FACS1894132_06930 [Clostridia bacterium]|nr:hypothetical protein FACS1894132_06930 [Clostridia bacterium]